MEDPITSTTTNILKDILREIERRVGLTLSTQPLEVILGKVERAAHALGMKNLEELCSVFYTWDAKSEGPPESILQVLIDNLTVTETFFFRGAAVLEHIVREAIPLSHLLEGRMSIWSAAGATGEEPYTLAMMILEKYPFVAFRGRPLIIATDINRKALDKALTGVYSGWSLSFRNMPQRYFRFFECLGGNLYRVRPEVRSLVAFQQANLLDERTWPSGRFIICLLRNVLYYFDESVRKSIVEKVKGRLESGGILVLGETEQLRDETGFRVVLGPEFFYYVKDPS